MKIAVYTIALNEEQHVVRWALHNKDADYLMIVDTGSTDKTVELAKSLGIVCHTISVKPWRFDDARNAALALLPDDIDYCVSVDMDEMLMPGWRKALEKTKVTRPRYQYTWNFNQDGTPGLTFGGDHIHTRHGYRWKNAVHEILVPDRIEETAEYIDLEIHHHADASKSRGQYLPLLALTVKEAPNDERSSFYYARELFFHTQYPQAIEEFKRYLSMPHAQWKPERAAAMRYIANMVSPDLEEMIKWFKAAVEEDPARREAYVELAKLYYEEKRWEECLEASTLALAIEEKPLDFLCESWAWGPQPWDYAAISCYYLSTTESDLEEAKVLLERAIKYGTKAVELQPNEERLQQNLAFYLKEPSVGNNL